MIDKECVVEIPKGARIYKRLYVYINTDSKYDPQLKYTKSKRKCIGKLIDDKTMHPNDFYKQQLTQAAQDVLPEAPSQSDSLSVGLTAVLNKIARNIGLKRSLRSIFEPKIADFILDLAMYNIATESGAFQHYAAFAFSNALFSKKVLSDSTISRFFQKKVYSNEIYCFLKEWFKQNDGKSDETTYLCYDSTNINSMAKDIDVAQKGYAKDDPSKPQVNLEYIVRQRDGLPLFYKSYPGSIVDVTECKDMIKNITALGYHNAIVICDRGYAFNVIMQTFDEARIDFLMMLRAEENTKDVIKIYGPSIKLCSERYIESHNVYGDTFELNIDGTSKTRYVHIVWDQEKAYHRHEEIMQKVRNAYESLTSIQAGNKAISNTEYNKLSKYYDITVEPETRKILSFEIKSKEIDEKVELSGYYVMVSSIKLTCEQAVEAYSKRDCVEKTFRALKSNLGLEALRNHSDDAIDGKLFVLFIASILRSSLFNSTKTLRLKDRKNFTIPAIIKELNKIIVIRNSIVDKYVRKYELTAKQKNILSQFSINEKKMDEFIRTLNSSYKKMKS